MKQSHLKELLENEQHQEILDQLLEFERKSDENLFLMKQIGYVFYKSRALGDLQRFEKALQVSKQAQELISPEDKVTYLVLLIVQLYVLNQLNRLTEAEKVIFDGDTIIGLMSSNEYEEGKEWIALFYNFKGNFYYQKEEWDNAIDYYKRSLTLKESVDTLTNIGWIYYHQKGKYDKALTFFERCLALSKTISNPHYIALSLNNIGFIYTSKEEYYTALDYYHRSLTMFEAQGSPLAVTMVTTNIGTTYRKKGELAKALSDHQRCLKIQREENDHEGTAFSLFSLFLITLYQQDQNNAQKYQKKLETLYEHIPHKDISLYNKIAKALILKESKRMRDKVKAQTLLREVVNLERRGYTAGAVFHLCELLLDELKLYGDPEVLIEINNLMQKLYLFAQEQELYSNACAALILQSKLAAIEGNFQQALEHLSRAEKMAEERNLGRLVLKIQNQHRILNAELDKWQELTRRNAPLTDRLEHAKLEEYLKEARRITGR